MKHIAFLFRMDMRNSAILSLIMTFMIQDGVKVVS